MNFYRTYFEKEIKILVYISFFLSLFSVIFDEFANYSIYPSWISQYNYCLVVLILILVASVYFRKINSRTAFLIFVYAFTVNIYLPGYFADEDLRLNILSSFSNLGPLMIYLFMATLVGTDFHVLILGLVNVLFMLSLYVVNFLDAGKYLAFDFVNIIMFIGTSLMLYIAFRMINKSLKENELNKKKIEAHKTELLNLRIEEEKKQNEFLRIIQEKNSQTMNDIVKKLNSINHGNKAVWEDKINDIKAFCSSKKYEISSSQNLKISQDVDSEFIVNLKNMYPELTVKERYICNLISFNMTTKDIALNMNMSAETIKWYRKRIRKKLKLEKGKSLSGFLNSIG